MGAERLKDLDPDGMRVEPLGEDSNNITYWYFFGVRLYKEVKKPKVKRPKKKKDDEKEEEKGKGKGKKSKKVVQEIVEEEVDEEPREAPGWYLACSTEAQWNDLVLKYKKSKKRQDRELYEVLVENFMPEISKMFQEKEKEEKIKILMMNKRSSNRLDRKRAEKEQEFEARRREEERRELQRRAEEEEQKMREKENKQRGREVRAKQREQKVAETEISGLQANRKRGGDSGQGRLRGSPRDVVQEDHDYTKRRSPALREWQRLSSQTSEEGDHGNRNLRL